MFRLMENKIRTHPWLTGSWWACAATTAAVTSWQGEVPTCASGSFCATRKQRQGLEKASNLLVWQGVVFCMNEDKR